MSVKMVYIGRNPLKTGLGTPTDTIAQEFAEVKIASQSPENGSRHSDVRYAELLLSAYH